MFDAREHPDSPSVEELNNYVLEPVPPAEIRSRREDGDTLQEANLQEHDDVDAYLELTDARMAQDVVDVGTALYRLVQLFGTPQFPEYHAGNDISWRTNDTFKYLFRVGRLEDDIEDGDEELDPESVEVVDEGLITVYDWKTQAGVSLAEWQPEDDTTPIDVDEEHAVTMLALLHNVLIDPVECEYEGIWF